MRAAFVAVGSELLGTDRLDTNSLRITAALRRYGVELTRKSVVGDSEEELQLELRWLAGRFELVVVSGGLGPTADDVTREAAAIASGRALVLDPGILAQIEARFRAFGREMPEVNRKQAEVIEGSEVMANRRGTAPGLRLGIDGTSFFLLPGVPAELDAMVISHLEPWLRERSGSDGLEMAALKVACLPESEVEQRIAPFYREFGRKPLSVLSSPGEVRLQLIAGGPQEERRRRLEAMADRLTELVGAAVFTRRADEELEDVVGRLLRGSGSTVATAESCTGGLVARRLTEVPGSSAYFVGGVVAYDNSVKSELLGVSPELLAEHGAVSEPVAGAMAEGVRRALSSDYGVAVTGVAGPGGGSEEKPVGTVHVAVAGAAAPVSHLRVRFPGDRRRVRRQASQLALELLRRRLRAGFPDGEGVEGR